MASNARARSAGTIGLLILVGCGGGSAPEAAVPVPLPRPYPVPASAYLYTGNTAPIPQAETAVLRDASTFRRYWLEATSELRNPPPVRDVDFSDGMVLYVAAGRSDRGTRVQVDSVGFSREMTGTGATRRIMEVHYSRVAPCTPLPGDSFPVQFVLLERSDLEVRFEREEKTCPG